ncbi:sugar nucleotide-binding protein [Modicisalibacter tunisiensis]|uniref:sugar nucleotide-binding protein n=1 Tax=Modicisalibacter tunisiensis TaxID=390637 RepID=UPI00362ACD8D
MNILITGANGQVGFELRRHFSLVGNVLSPDRATLDLGMLRASSATWQPIALSLF